MSIFLGGTGSGNELHDYEEGNFSPNLRNGGSHGTNYAKYVKIGRLVYINIYMHSVIPTANNSSFEIGNLPFTCNGQSHGWGGLSYVGNSAPSAVHLMPLVATNNTYIYFHRQDGTSANWNNNQWRSTQYNAPILFGVLYETDA